MGWVTADGRHKGYLAPMFGDGQRGRGVTAASVPPDEVVVGDEVQREDGSWTWPTRPAGEATGWVVCCDCYRNTSLGPASSWVGPVFTRVPSKTLENLTARRIFAATTTSPTSPTARTYTTRPWGCGAPSTPTAPTPSPR